MPRITLYLDAKTQALVTTQTKAASLRKALEAGERSGPSQPFDFDRFLQDKHRDASRR